MPSYKDIIKLISPEQLTILEQKEQQGFTDLLLVPFALNQNIYQKRVVEVVKKHHSQNTLLRTKQDPSDPDEPFPLDPDNPVYQFQNDLAQRAVFYPKTFADNSEDCHGYNQTEAIQQFGAIQITFVRSEPNLPAQGEGKDKIQGNRIPFEANQSSQNAFDLINTNSAYAHELGWTYSTWFAYLLTHLDKTNQLIDDWQGNGKASYLTGQYFPSARGSAYAGSDFAYRRFFLNLNRVGYRNQSDAVRSAVIVPSNLNP